MKVQLRPIAQEDVANCGRICYQAFKEISEQHGFRRDFSSPDISTQMLQSLADDPAVFGIVAESNGKVIGSNFLWQHDAIAGVGPITIDSQAQSQGVGRLLMRAVLEHGSDCNGIRLVQDAFNLASFSLYSSLDFDVKEPLVLIEGLVKAPAPAGYELRKMRAEDLAECAALCNRSIGTGEPVDSSASRHFYRRLSRFGIHISSPMRRHRIVGPITTPWLKNRKTCKHS